MELRETVPKRPFVAQASVPEKSDTAGTVACATA